MLIISILTDGMIQTEWGMWILSLVVLVYVASGGLRAVAYVDTVQCILLALGIFMFELLRRYASVLPRLRHRGCCASGHPALR